MEAPTPWRATGEGVEIRLRLTPRGGRERIDGIETQSDGRPVLRARVAAPPAEGAANAALVRLLARALGVPASSVRIAAGAAARIKTVRVTGDPAALSDLLARIVLDTA
jgi:uncharacterized protein (TIGR00251 family)